MFGRDRRKKWLTCCMGWWGGGAMTHYLAAATTALMFIKYKSIEITRYFHYNLFNIHYTQANKFARGKYFGLITQRS